MQPFTFSIDLPVQSQWRNVDLLRTSVQNCFIAVFADIDGCNAIAMVTGELVENAVKYGHWTGGSNTFRLRVQGRPGAVTVQVENPIDPENPGTDALDSRLRAIEAFPSAEAAYKARLLEIAADNGEISGLGLVRCAYEGNSRLHMETIDKTAVRVTADMTF